MMSIRLRVAAGASLAVAALSAPYPLRKSAAAWVDATVPPPMGERWNACVVLLATLAPETVA